MSKPITMPAELAEIIATHRALFGGFVMQAEPSTEGAEEAQKPEPPRTFTQEDVDRIVADRLKREDIKGLRQKAAQFDELEQSSKSEMDRLTEQVTALTEAQKQAEAKATRYRIAAANGISEADADLFLTGSDEESITAQAKRLAEHTQAKKKQGDIVPHDRGNPGEGVDEDAMARKFFGF